MIENSIFHKFTYEKGEFRYHVRDWKSRFHVNFMAYFTISRIKTFIPRTTKNLLSP